LTFQTRFMKVFELIWKWKCVK